MRIRRAYAIAAMGALTATGVAQQANAASKPKPKPIPPVCNLVTDPADDAKDFLILTGALPSSEPALDIISGDVATDAKNLTAVVRVKDLSGTSTSPTGRTYYFYFTVGSTQFFLNADDDAISGKSGGVGYVGTTGRASLTGGVAPTVVWDTAKNEIRMTTPLSSFASKETIKPKTKLTALNILAQRLMVAITPTADTTAEGKDYSAGALSCVKVGK